MRHISHALAQTVEGLAPDETADLISTLERIGDVATRARRQLTHGGLVNGRTSIRRIEEEAGDALARVAERHPDTEVAA